jgi:hypothetical protein
MIAIFLSILAGCMIIPTPEHGLLEGRGMIAEIDTAFLQSAKTTRQEVLLRFGEPDLILDHDRILVYHWAVSHGYWAVGAYYTAAGGPIPKDYLFVLEFDDRGFLKRFEKTGSIWTSARARLDKWTPPGSEQPTDPRRTIFMIDPVPRAPAKPDRPDAPVAPLAFQMGKFCYRDGDVVPDAVIGHKVAAFGVIVADVRTSRPFVEMVRSAVMAQIQIEGHRLADQDASVIVTGQIAQFGVTTAISLASWDAIGSLDVTLKIHSSTTPHDPLVRRYQSTQVAKTFMGPTKDDFEQVMRACLEDLQSQMAADTPLARWLDGGAR